METRKKLFTSVNNSRERISLFSENKVETQFRKSLFSNEEQRAFSNKPETELESNLKLYSGKELEDAEIEKIFSTSTQELIKNGYARKGEDERTKILDTAFLQSKLFAKLRIITIKELDLDPVEDKSQMINQELEDKLGLPKKAVMIIRKAHCMPERQMTFSELEDWLIDSGIEKDLQLEFGGETMNTEEFNNLIDTRYNDAPENILEVLREKGIISVDNDEITINN